MFSGLSQSVKTSAESPAFLNKTLSAEYKDQTLEQILLDITTSQGIDFFYANQLPALQAKITVSFKEKTLSKVLNDLLSPRNIGYMVMESGIVLIPEKVAEEVAKEGSALEDSLTIMPVAKTASKKPIRKYTYSGLKKKTLFSSLPWESRIEKPIPSFGEEDSLVYHKKTLRKLRKHYLSYWLQRKMFSVQVGFRPELTWWDMSAGRDADLEIKRYNSYKNPSLSFSLGAEGQLQIHRWIFFAGLNFTNLTRKGIHSEYQVDYLNSDVSHEITSNYSSNYNLFGFTGGAGYIFKAGLFQVHLLAGIDNKFMLRMAGARYFPYYESKYFLFGPPYYNKSFEPLSPEKINFRTYLPVTFQSVKCIFFIQEKLDVVSSLSFQQFLTSIYTDDPVVNEKPLVAGVEIGVRYNFR